MKTAMKPISTGFAEAELPTRLAQQTLAFSWLRSLIITHRLASAKIIKMADQEEVSFTNREPSTPDLDEGENDEAKGSVRVVSGSGFRYVVPFPWRLHQMLEAIEEAGDAPTVSWLPDGQHFQVHNPQSFVEKVIPKFFKQKSYKSFQRQLHLYGFQRETEGPCRGKNHYCDELRE